jgi:hypothetical protein
MSGNVLLKRRGILRSNLDRPLRSNGRGAFFSTGETGRWGAAPWPTVWAAPPRSKDHHLTNRQLLRHLDVERNSFCPLTVAEKDGGKLATRRRLGQSSTVVGASSSGALALGSTPAAVEWLGQPLRGLAWRGRLRVGTVPVARFRNGSGNGKKCSGGRRRVLFIGANTLAGAQQQPDPNLQLNLGFGEGIDK